MEVTLLLPKPQGSSTKLGITMESGYDGDQGNPRIQMLRSGSLSRKAGLLPGDIVTHINGKPVTNHLEATTLIAKAETDVTLVLLRAEAAPKRSKSFKAMLGRSASKAGKNLSQGFEPSGAQPPSPEGLWEQIGEATAPLVKVSSPSSRPAPLTSQTSIVRQRLADQPPAPLAAAPRAVEAAPAAAAAAAEAEEPASPVKLPSDAQSAYASLLQLHKKDLDEQEPQSPPKESSKGLSGLPGLPWAADKSPASTEPSKDKPKDKEGPGSPRRAREGAPAVASSPRSKNSQPLAWGIDSTQPAPAPAPASTLPAALPGMALVQGALGRAKEAFTPPVSPRPSFSTTADPPETEPPLPPVSPSRALSFKDTVAGLGVKLQGEISPRLRDAGAAVKGAGDKVGESMVQAKEHIERGVEPAVVVTAAVMTIMDSGKQAKEDEAEPAPPVALPPPRSDDDGSLFGFVGPQPAEAEAPTGAGHTHGGHLAQLVGEERPKGEMSPRKDTIDAQQKWVLEQEESYAQKLAAEKLSEEKDKPLLPWARAGGGAAEGGEGTSPKSWEHIRQLWKQMSEATLLCAAPRSAKANKPVPSILAVGGKPIAVGEQ